MDKEQIGIPKLRFPGFTDAWEQRKLGEIFEKNNERNIDMTFSEKYTISISSMIYRTSGNGAKKSSLSSYKVLRIGDIAYEGHTNKEYKFGRFVLNDLGDGIMSPRFTALRPKIKLNILFWKEYIHYEPMMRRVLVRSTKQGTMMNELVTKDFYNESIFVPNDLEQTKIGYFLSELNCLIALHQRKLEHLKQQKNGLLQKMFPKNGESVPEVRFPGFTDSWERRRLGEVADSVEYGINAPAKEYDGINKYLRITDIDDTTHEFLQSDLTSPDTDLTLAEKFKLLEGDILFARTGASVGKSYIYSREDGSVYYAGFLIRMRFNQSISPNFIFQNTLTTAYKQYVEVTSQRSGQPGVNAKEYSNYSLYIPSKEEQQKIGLFFQQLDTLIALQQRRIEHLELLKKGLLQQMFV